MTLVNSGSSAELWRRAAMVLKELRGSFEKINEMERLVNQIKNELVEKAGQEHYYAQNNFYEKNYLLAKLQASLENFRREMEELKGMEKSLQALCQRVDLDEKIHEQIKEQLRKKMQIILKEK